MKMDLHSFMYLDIEETDGTLYLSQIPSARSRSLKIIVIVSSVRSSSGYHGLLEGSSSHFFRFFKFFRF